MVSFILKFVKYKIGSFKESHFKDFKKQRIEIGNQKINFIDILRLIRINLTINKP